MKPVRYFLAVAVVVAALAALTMEGTPQPTTATLPSTTTAPTSTGKDLRTQAVSDLLEGKFAEGLALLGDESLKSDPVAAKARALAADYLSVRARYDQERQGNLAAEEARVRLARLAEKQRPRLVEAKLADELFSKVEAIADALSGADRLLTPGSTSQPAQVMPEARKLTDKALSEYAAAAKLLGDGQGEYGQAVQGCGDALKRAIEAYLAIWEKTRLPEDWDRLERAFEKVQDAVIDLGVLVSRDPLITALAHAREAKELSGNEEAFLQQDWVKELIRDSERRGQELLGQAKWSEALRIYGHSGLSDLDENNVAYKDTVKKISQHVRVLNLYGRNGTTQPGVAGFTPASAPTTRAVRPAGVESPDPADEPKWREMIVGIDAVMVRNAINQIDDNFVERPNYRKIAAGALNAVRVLAETRQADRAFPALANEAKRAAFVAAVDQQAEQFKKGTVEHLYLGMALDRLLDINAETLNLPSEVIDMEFTEGMLGELDEFTSMIWPYEEDDFNKRTMGSFFGIGVQIRKDPGKPIEVVTPLPETPALRAGVLAGDWIIRVDGRATDTLSIERAVKMITGLRHTRVALTIQRAGRAMPFDLEVERDEIHIQTVKGWRAQADGKWDYFIDPASRIAYVRVTQFTNDTSEDIRQALKSARENGADGVILDLRFNPGGLLNSAVDMADEFLRRGLIVRTEGRNVLETPKDATALGEYQEGKVVVLMNKYSASAAEIVAGALKDWRRAVIVGERTYGKGSVQRLIPVKGKKAKLKLTTAYYYLPSGRCLHRTNGAKEWGVDPDVSAPVTMRQMNRWAEIRQETDLLKNVDPARLSSLLKQQLQDDLQLQTALMLMKVELLR